MKLCVECFVGLMEERIVVDLVVGKFLLVSEILDSLEVW